MESYSKPNVSIYRKRYIKLDVYHKSKEIIHYKETKKYETLMDFISNLGGSMSILMGVSFLTILEVLEDIFVLLKDIFLGKYKTK